jgi:NADH-quinone oxidoreductase subunit J
MLGADFLGFVFMIIYVGAIAVLFLFIVMMLNISVIEFSTVFLYYLPISILIIFVFFFEFSYVIDNMVFYNLHIAYLDLFSMEKPLNFISFVQPVSYITLFGNLLYNYFFMEFIVAGLILLLAMIGSISLTLNQVVILKREDIFVQVSREISDSIKLINLSNFNK